MPDLSNIFNGQSNVIVQDADHIDVFTDYFVELTIDVLATDQTPMKHKEIRYVHIIKILFDRHEGAVRARLVDVAGRMYPAKDTTGMPPAAVEVYNLAMRAMSE